MLLSNQMVVFGGDPFVYLASPWNRIVEGDIWTFTSNIQPKGKKVEVRTIADNSSPDVHLSFHHRTSDSILKADLLQ